MWPLRGARWFSLYYRYRIAGREYVRTRYQFAHTWLTFGAIRRTAAELTANRDVAVYVDPADPGRATLRSGLHWTAYGLAVLSWLILAEVNLVFFLVRR